MFGGAKLSTLWLEGPRQSFYLELAELSPFPRGIETIAIVWLAGSGSAKIKSAARSAWAALATAHPSLQCVYFAWPGTRCLYSRKWNGEFYEQISKQPGSRRCEHEHEHGKGTHSQLLTKLSAIQPPAARNRSEASSLRVERKKPDALRVQFQIVIRPD
ncbi:hypothetical protein B0H12DRAFT_1070516 [Mycena haematopus]|nr:hypothetical protein B0H12DRAFT_1070516 [Mycena haematopus]